MIHELEHPERLKRNPLTKTVTLKESEFKTITGAAAQTYSAENEADRVRRELQEFKKAYNPQQVNVLKRGCHSKITNLQEKLSARDAESQDLILKAKIAEKRRSFMAEVIKSNPKLTTMYLEQKKK